MKDMELRSKIRFLGAMILGAYLAGFLQYVVLSAEIVKLNVKVKELTTQIRELESK